MKLEEIIKGAGAALVKGAQDVETTLVCQDSRKVVPGALFIAVKGHEGDGHRHIASAIENGARAIAYEDGATLEEQLSMAGNPEVTLVHVEDSRKAMAVMASNFYGNPSSRLKLVGITGTNGKTTTVTLLYNLFMKLGYNCGLISTVANYVGRKRSETLNTTPDPITINSLLDEMVREGCEYCFMEVSSIGIEQDRVYALAFAAGIFSNLTHDHLDYHKTFAEYLRCKKEFFDSLPKGSFAIVNIDDRNGEVMVQNTKATVVRYSCTRMADHTCRIKEMLLEGMLLELDGQEVWTRLIGGFNACNILAAYSTAVSLGADPHEVMVAVSSLGSAPGRLETVSGPRNLTVVIDYAHTPDALDNVLSTLREICKGTLVCCFGCGGDRDATKRPEMAAVAGKYADRIIVTSDNSRSERTEDIMEDIRKGFSNAELSKALFIPDRKEAIRTAILTSPQGAAILLAGKGHETYQIIGGQKRHFDEREVVAEVFGNM